MKKIVSLTLALLLMLSLALSLVACGETPSDPSAEGSLWDTAIYSSDATVGEGSKTVTVSFTAEGKTVTLTVKTDADNLGAALYALALVNDPSFFDTANGMQASWAKHKAYWAFYIGDAYATSGIDDTAVTGGESFSLVYTVSP